MFAKRLEDEKLDADIFVSRFDKCNILLNNAISNINRRKNKTFPIPEEHQENTN